MSGILEYRGRRALLGVRPRDAQRVLTDLALAHESEILRLQARLEMERLRRDALRGEVERLEEASAIQADLWQRLDRSVVGPLLREAETAEQLFSLSGTTDPEKQPSRRKFTVVGGSDRSEWSPGRIGSDTARETEEETATRPTRTFSANPVKHDPPSARGQQPPMANAVMRYLEGKVVGAGLQRVDGKMLAERGTPITRELVAEATRHGVLAELILHMAYPDELSN